MSVIDALARGLGACEVCFASRPVSDLPKPCEILVEGRWVRGALRRWRLTASGRWVGEVTYSDGGEERTAVKDQADLRPVD